MDGVERLLSEVTVSTGRKRKVSIVRRHYVMAFRNHSEYAPAPRQTWQSAKLANEFSSALCHKFIELTILDRMSSKRSAVSLRKTE